MLQILTFLLSVQFYINIVAVLFHKNAYLKSWIRTPIYLHSYIQRVISRPSTDQSYHFFFSFNSSYIHSSNYNVNSSFPATILHARPSLFKKSIYLLFRTLLSRMCIHKCVIINWYSYSSRRVSLSMTQSRLLKMR
jgi:hypothetical protein